MSKERKAAANKGFSLVELIIVIAIMAILGVVLAPQFTKYVERSRQSTDRQNVAAIVTALQVYAIDPEATPKIANNAEIKLTVGNVPLDDENCTGNTKAALESAGINEIGLKSEQWKDKKIDLTITVNDEGVLSVVSSDPDIFKETKTKTEGE